MMPIATVLAALPMRIKLVAGLAVVVAAFLAAGVPLSTFIPYAGLAACLGMHLFMGHSHGDRHSASDEHSPEPVHGPGPVEQRTLDG